MIRIAVPEFKAELDALVSNLLAFQIPEDVVKQVTDHHELSNQKFREFQAQSFSSLEERFEKEHKLRTECQESRPKISEWLFHSAKRKMDEMNSLLFELGCYFTYEQRAALLKRQYEIDRFLWHSYGGKEHNGAYGDMHLDSIIVKSHKHVNSPLSQLRAEYERVRAEVRVNYDRAHQGGQQSQDLHLLTALKESDQKARYLEDREQLLIKQSADDIYFDWDIVILRITGYHGWSHNLFRTPGGRVADELHSDGDDSVQLLTELRRNLEESKDWGLYEEIYQSGFTFHDGHMAVKMVVIWSQFYEASEEVFVPFRTLAEERKWFKHICNPSSFISNECHFGHKWELYPALMPPK